MGRGEGKYIDSQGMKVGVSHGTKIHESAEVSSI